MDTVSSFKIVTFVSILFVLFETYVGQCVDASRGNMIGVEKNVRVKDYVMCLDL
jgi:hypothetical protein